MGCEDRTRRTANANGGCVEQPCKREYDRVSSKAALYSRILLYQNLRQPGGQSSQDTLLPSGMNLGTGVRVVATEKLFTQGSVLQTGNCDGRGH